MSMDYANSLSRTARRHGWTECPPNSLDYYTQRFTRPEPDGRSSVVRVRITHRIVDAQCEIGGLRQSFTLPTLQRIESLLAFPVPAPDHRAPKTGELLFAKLAEAVDEWTDQPKEDSHPLLAEAGNRLANAAAELLRNLKGGKECQ